MKKLFLVLLLLVPVIYLMLSSRDDAGEANFVKGPTDKPNDPVNEEADNQDSRRPIARLNESKVTKNDRGNINDEFSETEMLLSTNEKQLLQKYQNDLSKHQILEKKLQLMRDSQSESEKDELYREIFETTDNALTKNQITNLEALDIKLITAKSRLATEEYKIEAQRLRDEYSRASKLEWEDYLENRDEEFLNYKEAQKRLLTRINNMTEFPNGLSKKEYLKQEIEKIKLEVYK